MKFSGIMIALALLLCAAVTGSIAFGAANIPLEKVIHSFTHYTGTQEQLIIRTARVPRALIAAAVGASLAVAGALMQVIARNPIASPSTFGVNAGAAFFAVSGAGLFGIESMQGQTWSALLGAAVSGFIVFAMGSMGRDGMTPVKITLAGASIAAFFASITQGYMFTSGKKFDQVLAWLVGSVASRELSVLLGVLPYMGAGMLLALALGRHLNVLAMGDSLAQGLGQSTARIKALAALAIILLAGASVAAAGPIAFVGIIVPHLSRRIAGADYRRIIPCCALLGALLLVTADLGSRYIAMPKEVPVGVMTAIIGVPFFVHIARRGGMAR